MTYTPKEIKELVDYDAEHGELFWRERTADCYARHGNETPERTAKWFNGQYANQPLGYSFSNDIAVARLSLGKGTPTLRRSSAWFAWVLATGEIPGGTVAVLDGDYTNLHPDNVANCSKHVSFLLRNPGTGLYSYSNAAGAPVWRYTISDSTGTTIEERQGFASQEAARGARDASLQAKGLWTAQTLAAALNGGPHGSKTDRRV